jgi:regulator of sirC expression with transglutaminase-like and TPR domain
MTDDILQLGLVDDDEIILDEAALSLALLDHPETDLDPYADVLSEIAERLAEEGDEASADTDRAALLADVIGGEFGFAGDRDTYDHPDNADLIRVIDRRRGLPVSLSILYVAAARRVGWDADALDVPGHVLVLIGDAAAPVVVDPFRGGVTVTTAELAALVAAADRGPAPPVRHVAAMPNRAVLARLLRNQATRAEASGDAVRARTLYERITAFAPDQGDAWWERARLELGSGDLAAARASLSAMLETTRDPEIRARVSETLAALAP